MNQIKKILETAIAKELTLNIIAEGLEDSEISTETGTVFEIDEGMLFIEEHYYLFKDHKDESKGKDEHIVYHLFRIANIKYIGAA